MEKLGGGEVEKLRGGGKVGGTGNSEHVAHMLLYM